MKTLYIDCSMGAAGDMLTAALLELLPDPDSFLRELNALGIPGVQWRRERAVKCGITGTHVSVLVNGEEEAAFLHEYAHKHGLAHEHAHDHDHARDHDHDHAHDHDHDHAHDHDHGHHHHSDLHWIGHIVEDLRVPDAVKADILAVYQLIADAESAVHGVPVSEVHFHEVGALDAVADVTAVCLLMDRLGPDEVVVSPIHVGSGHVHCAHGILPVPAPATALLLKGLPIYGGEIEGELCTPTGAALIRRFAARFGPMPAMRASGIGYGCGKKDFPRANCVRAMLGESDTPPETIAELTCTVDDMTAEEIGFALERLFAGGAREVYTVPVGMKKNRPGTLLRVLCRKEDREKIAELIFRHTSTIGICAAEMERLVLSRRFEARETPFGAVQVKAVSGYGVQREKIEYEDLARIARERDLGLREVRGMLEEGSGGTNSK